MKAQLVLGIMSGTSIDSVDFALCAIGEDNATHPSWPGISIRLKKRWQVKFPRALQQRLHQAAQGTATSHATAQLHHDLGRFYANAAKKVLGNARPDIVGLHGLSFSTGAVANDCEGGWA